MKKIIINGGGFSIFNRLFSKEVTSYQSNTQIDLNWSVKPNTYYILEISGITKGSINVYDGSAYLVITPTCSSNAYNGTARVSFFTNANTSKISFVKFAEDISELKFYLYEKEENIPYLGNITSSAQYINKLRGGQDVMNVVKAATDTETYKVYFKPLFTGVVRIYYNGSAVANNVSVTAGEEYTYEVTGVVGVLPMVWYTSMASGTASAFVGFWKK